ncbi:MAG: hypothetical protein D6785_15405 [Planctomycetota bacterium]|nr:MAG: hypothetical protein D6785_15405 [Planctomycetota bacterium]
MLALFFTLLPVLVYGISYSEPFVSPFYLSYSINLFCFFQSFFIYRYAPRDHWLPLVFLATSLARIILILSYLVFVFYLTILPFERTVVWTVVIYFYFLFLEVLSHWTLYSIENTPNNMEKKNV